MSWKEGKCMRYLRSKAVQQWEYFFVFATVSNDGEFRPRFANDEELIDWQAGPTMYEYAPSPWFLNGGK